MSDLGIGNYLTITFINFVELYSISTNTEDKLMNNKKEFQSAIISQMMTHQNEPPPFLNDLPSIVIQLPIYHIALYVTVTLRHWK